MQIYFSFCFLLMKHLFSIIILIGWQDWEMFVDALIRCPCVLLVSKDLATFFDSPACCLSFKALLAWELAISLSIRPLTNAIKGLLQTLPLPTTTKSFRFSNYTKFCQMSNLIWMIWMWCEHRRPGAGWEIEMLQLCWIQIHEICSVDAEAENAMFKQQESFGASGTIDHLHQNQCIDLVLVMPPGTAGFSQSIKRGLLLQFEFASSRVRWNLRWSKTVDPARQSSRSGLRNFKFKDATL